MSESLNRNKLAEYVKKAQQNVAYCPNCQPADTGEEIWVFGSPMLMDEFLHDHKIPEKYHEYVAEALHCNNCGSPLGMSCEVGVEYLITPEQYKLEKLWDSKWKIWNLKNNEKFKDFYEFLEKYPYLGAHHNLGKRILKIIGKSPKSKLENSLFYRAVKCEQNVVINTERMYPPNPEERAITEGRYNHFGQRVFYLANSEEGAAKEKLDETENEKTVWMQKFKIKHVDNILDLSPYDDSDKLPEQIDPITFGLIYGGVLQRPVMRATGWKPEYFIPRFIADCAKMYGVAGIQFLNTKHYIGDFLMSKNLVLFDWSKENIEPVDEPYEYKLIERKPFILDL